MSNKFFQYGFFVLLAAAIIAYTFKGRGDKKYIKSLETQVEQLQVQVDSIQVLNASLEAGIAALSDSIDSLDIRAQEIETKRLNAIRYYEKRLKNINSLTTHQLDSLFAGRYGLGSVDSQEDSH